MLSAGELGAPRGERGWSDVEVGSAAEQAWARLEDQLRWYDTKSIGCQRLYKRWKVAELVAAATVPVAALAAQPVVTASLAAAVVVLGGLQQVFQWQTNWIQYRSTAEALKHERFLFLAVAGPYGGDDRVRVLAERVEGLVSQEHATWTESRRSRVDGDAPAASVDTARAATER